MRTSLAVLGVLALLAVACWNGGEEATPTTRGARTVPAAPDGYADIAAVRFKELVGQRSSGRMSVEVYPSSQMGSERDLVEGAQLGWIDAGVVFAGILGGLLPEVGVVSLPFLFDGQDHVDAVFDGPVGRELLGLAEGVGIKALAIGQYGLRSIMNSWRPIYILADAADLRFGVPESDIDMRTYELVGANPVPLPGLEILPSLQNGVVDGTGAPIFAAITQKYYETPMRYLSLTEHIYAALLLFMSGELWDSLGPAAQELVQEAAIEATAPHQSQPIFGASKTRAVLKPYGMPDITNPFTSAYADVDVAPRWPISEEVAISVALTGGFFMTRHNRLSPSANRRSWEAGRACMRAGATALHIHVRNEAEWSILDMARFVTIIEPLQEEIRGSVRVGR